MPLAIKPVVSGVDEPIQRLQKKLFSVLCNTWTLGTGEKYQCFGRAYRNQDEKSQWIAEVYDPNGSSSNNEYREVYFDDNVSALSFFGLANESQISPEGMVTANVHLLFFVNLNKVKNGAYRNDEEARIDVHSVLNSYGTTMGFLVTRQVIGLDKVLAEYNGTRNSEGLIFRDQHPFYCFRFDMQVFYQPTLKKC